MVLVVASRRWMGGWGVGVVVKGDLPRSLPIVRPDPSKTSLHIVPESFMVEV